MNTKRLTLDELINMATENDKRDKYIEIYIKSLDSTIKAKKPDTELMLDALDTAKDNAHDGDLYLIYNSIVDPNFKDTKLHKAYNVTIPYKVIDKIFTLGEIASISKILTQDSGLYDSDGATIVDNLKN